MSQCLSRGSNHKTDSKGTTLCVVEKLTTEGNTYLLQALPSCPVCKVMQEKLAPQKQIFSVQVLCLTSISSMWFGIILSNYILCKQNFIVNKDP